MFESTKEICEAIGVKDVEDYIWKEYCRVKKQAYKLSDHDICQAVSCSIITKYILDNSGWYSNDNGYAFVTGETNYGIADCIFYTIDGSIVEKYSISNETTNIYNNYTKCETPEFA